MLATQNTRTHTYLRTVGSPLLLSTLLATNEQLTTQYVWLATDNKIICSMSFHSLLILCARIYSPAHRNLEILTKLYNIHSTIFVITKLKLNKTIFR